MANGSVTLPPGFVLDQPQKQQPKQTQLPQGFVVDQPKEDWESIENRTGISGQNIQQHPFQSIAKTVMQPSEKSLTGRSIEDKTRASILKQAGNENFKGMPAADVENKLKDIQDSAFKKTVGAQTADQLSTPANYIGAGIVKGGAQLAKAGVQKVGKFAGYEAGRLINSLIKPADKAFNFGKNPGMQVAREKIVANNMEDLGAKIKGKLEEASQALKQRLSTANNIPADYSGMLKPIDDAIASAKRLPKTNEALITRLENARSDLLQNRDLTKLTPQEAVQLKRDIGDVTKWTKEGTDDATANKALKQSYHSVKTTLEKNVQGIKADNERLANLIDAHVAATKRANMLQKSDLASGIFQKGALFDTAVGVARGDVHEVLRGIGEYGITKLLASPAAKTRMAQWLMNLNKSDLASALTKFPQLRRLIRISNNQRDVEPTLKGKSLATIGIGTEEVNRDNENIEKANKQINGLHIDGVSSRVTGGGKKKPLTPAQIKEQKEIEAMQKMAREKGLQ